MKCPNIRIIGLPEGEEEEQKIENLFEQIMKENFPNLAKEIDFREVQEAQRVPKKLDPRRNTPRHIIITLPLPIFLIGLFVFLEWSCVSSLYILEIKPLFKVSLANFLP